MNAPLFLTAPLDAATLAKVERLSRESGISEMQFAAEAIREAAAEERDFAAFVRPGAESADRGDVLTQEQVEAWFEERVAARTTG